MTKSLRDLLLEEHRRVVAEWSANMGAHAALRESFGYDEDGPVFDCEVCDALAAPAPALDGLREAAQAVVDAWAGVDVAVTGPLDGSEILRRGDTLRDALDALRAALAAPAPGYAR